MLVQNLAPRGGAYFPNLEIGQTLILLVEERNINAVIV
jgi:hypothetical protein